MQDHNFDVPNLDTVRESRGRSRPFLEDDPVMSVEDDARMSVEEDISLRPKRTSKAFAFFLVLLVVVGVGGTVALWSYGDQATDVIRAWALSSATSKPIAPPEALAEVQQQLKSLATDLAALRSTLERQSAANHDQLTRIQEQIAQQSIALQAAKQELGQKLSSAPSEKAVNVPLPKPAQHPAHVSTPDSSKQIDLSKPIQAAPPQSLLPPKQ